MPVPEVKKQELWRLGWLVPLISWADILIGLIVSWDKVMGGGVVEAMDACA